MKKQSTGKPREGISPSTENVVDKSSTLKVRKRILTGVVHSLEGAVAFQDSSKAERIDRLVKTIKKLTDLPNEDADSFTMKLYKSLTGKEIAEEVDFSDDMELIRFLLGEFYGLPDLSRKKVSVFALKKLFSKEYDLLASSDKKGVDKEKYVKKRVKDLFTSLSKLTYPIVTNLYDQYKMPLEFIRFYEAFLSDIEKDELSAMVEVEMVDEADIMALAEDFEIGGINIAGLKRTLNVRTAKEKKFSSFLDQKEVSTDSEIDIKDFKHKIVDSNGFINPNWFLYDIGVIPGFKVFGEEKTKYLFGKYFWGLMKKLNEENELGVDLPGFYNIFSFRLPKTAQSTTSSNSEESGQVDIYQHIIEWDIPEDWDDEKLEQIGIMMREQITDLNLNSGKYEAFRHPVKTVDGRCDAKGYFSGVKDLENTNLLIIKGRDSKERKIRLACDYGQDMFIYLIMQISHFLKHDKFINKNHLFSLIYRSYNNLTTENQKIFDITMFEEQYLSLVEKIIWPLSIEYIEKKGEPGNPKNTLLVGLYGTGKSQVLFNLLKNKKFKLGEKEFNLNANTININIFELVELISKDVSEFKKRLSDIHENTKLPILLIIEDIETIVNERAGESDGITQALTTFFEGVGSLPVTVISSTNYPERISNRLIRPNRLENIIKFDIPLPEKVIKSTLAIHIGNNIKEALSVSGITEEEFIARYIEKLNNFTASHIAHFIAKIKDKFEFNKEFNSSYKLSFEIIDEIFAGLLIPTSDIRVRQKEINDWYSSLKINGQEGIGFKG